MWKLTLLEGLGVYAISPAYDTTKYLMGSSNGYNGSVGFDNVINAPSLFQYSIDYPDSIVQLAGAKESFFNY